MAGQVAALPLSLLHTLCIQNQGDQLAFVADGRFKRSNCQPPNGKWAGWPVNQRIQEKETVLMGPYWLSVEPAPGPLRNITQRAAGETRGRSTLKCATKARQNYESQGTFVLRCLAIGFFSVAVSTL